MRCCFFSLECDKRATRSSLNTKKDLINYQGLLLYSEETNSQTAREAGIQPRWRGTVPRGLGRQRPVCSPLLSPSLSRQMVPPTACCSDTYSLFPRQSEMSGKGCDWSHVGKNLTPGSNCPPTPGKTASCGQFMQSC